MYPLWKKKSKQANQNTKKKKKKMNPPNLLSTLFVLWNIVGATRANIDHVDIDIT
jgi:hypothetical protein